MILNRLAAAARTALLGAGLALAAAPAAFAENNGIALDDPADLPAFSLEDHDGQPFTEASLKGHWSLILIGYTSCPDVCPFTLANLEHVISEVSQRVRPENLPKVVFLAVDPERDRSELKDYMALFHPDFLGVTGERAEIDKLVAGLDGAYSIQKPDETGWYAVNHSAAVSVIDPNGKLRAKLAPPFEAYGTADALARMQIEFRRESKKAQDS